MTQLIGLKSFHDTHKSQHNLLVVTLNAQLEANQCSQEKTKRLRWPPASGFFLRVLIDLRGGELVLAL